MKKNIFTIVCFLLPFFGTACSCFGPVSFCEVIDQGGEELVVLSGKKLNDIGHGMEIEVNRVFRGKESRHKVMVWGDNGILCRLYTSQFEIGEELILALHKIDTENNGIWGIEGEEIGDYTLSVCGLYYAKCDEDWLNPFTGEAEDLSACLGPDYCNCGDTPFNFYPNPTRGIIRASINISKENIVFITYNFR